ncbi:MAG: hypothetical protein ACAI44_30750 [Candidatus Sericytochromatia bacterium]
MDADDFKTLGECDFGTIWEVQSENKIVVNAYQAALYFSREDFFQFARMVEESIVAMTGKGFQQATKPAEPKPAAAPSRKDANAGTDVPQITDIRAFRRSRQADDEDEEEDDDFPG